MLWLAGLMGLMAVSTAVYVDLGGQEADDDAQIPEVQSTTDRLNLILGTGQADNINGTEEMDRIAGNDGDDLILGGPGDDEARGDDGDDTLAGESGEDSLIGADGDDDLRGGDDDDSLVGQNDDDSLYGEDGDDTLNGSDGDDMLSGGAGNDAVSGGLGNDALHGDSGEDTLFGGHGNDMLSGLLIDRDAAEIVDNDGMDYLNGGSGDDVIGIGQNDEAHGGSGADQFVLGDWITSGNTAAITDFDPDDDSLLFVWDDSVEGSEPPPVAVSSDPDMDGQLQVWLGEAIVAQVSGQSSLTAADIALIPLSSALALNLVSG